MVNLPIETKRQIVRNAANGMTQKENAAACGTSPTTLRRVLDEHKNGLFSLKDKPSKPKSSKVMSPSDIKKQIQKSVNKEKTKTKAVSKDTDDKIKQAVNEFSYIITPINASFVIDGVATSIDATHPNYSRVIDALLAADGETALKLANVSLALTSYMKGNVNVKDGVVYYRDLEIHGGMTSRILDAMGKGDESQVDVLVSFFDNLMLNPSRRAVNELYGFLEANDIELTDDGHFIAYKRVRADYTDIRTGTFDNKPGSKVWMLRHQVNDNKEQTCSAGLHVCSKSYLPHFSSRNPRTDRIVTCKVNPRDVVSVPVDYNNAKLRCSEYVVLEDVSVLNTDR